MNNFFIINFIQLPNILILAYNINFADICLSNFYINNIDITFTQNNDGSISASGTAFNSATGRIDPFIQDNMNSIYFNNLLSRFDQITE